jgi:hypothetical protein
MLSLRTLPPFTRLAGGIFALAPAGSGPVMTVRGGRDNLRFASLAPRLSRKGLDPRISARARDARSSSMTVDSTNAWPGFEPASSPDRHR